MKIVSTDKLVYNFTNDMVANVVVENGEVFKVETLDCFSNKVSSDATTLGSITSHDLNPATGPIFVKDAEPGDILEVKILDIQVASKGITGTLSDSGILEDVPTKSIIKSLEVVDGLVDFNGLRLPIDPMIGVIGLAPRKEDGDWPTETPWKHGGNMDTKSIRKNSTVYLPVNVSGAMLAMGDCHALMADGEMSLGLEIASTITLEVNVIKNKTINWPLVETPTSTMVIASGENLNQASYYASEEAIRILEEALGFDFEDAYTLASLVVDLKISQAVNDYHTVRAAIPKTILSAEQIIGSL